MTKRVCRRCGKTFVPKAPNQHYCAKCRPLHLMEYNLDYGRRYAAHRKLLYDIDTGGGSHGQS